MSSAARTRTASRSLRRMRFLTTALPVFLVTVIPKRGASSVPRSSTSSRNSLPRRFSPPRTARYSARLRSLPTGWPVVRCANVSLPAPRVGGERLAAARAARGGQAPVALGGQAGAEAGPLFADELRGLIGTLPLSDYRGVRPFLVLPLLRSGALPS